MADTRLETVRHQPLRQSFGIGRRAPHLFYGVRTDGFEVKVSFHRLNTPPSLLAPSLSGAFDHEGISIEVLENGL